MTDQLELTERRLTVTHDEIADAVCENSRDIPGTPAYPIPNILSISTLQKQLNQRYKPIDASKVYAVLYPGAFCIWNIVRALHPGGGNRLRGRPQGSPNRHQAKLGREAGGRAIRRGEGGGADVEWAFMVARAGDASLFLQGMSQGNRTRATIKALPTSLHPPSPLRHVMGFS